MAKAVFLDRDGVLNHLVFNPNTQEYESPHRVQELRLFPKIDRDLKQLQDNGFLLFLVSNQPSFAKGKTTLENIQAIHDQLHQNLMQTGIKFTEYFYCYHHPDGIVPSFSGPCPCRKPSPFFLNEAKAKYVLDMSQSWMIGDEGRDIQCGQAAGVKTILVEYKFSIKKRGQTTPNFRAGNLDQAVQHILWK